jgi:hypothetical protein
MKKLLPFVVVCMFGCGETDSYEKMRQREYDMWHQPLPKPLDQIKTDIYDKPIKSEKCCKTWLIKATDDNNIEVNACRRINETYWVYLNVDCTKPHTKNLRFHGRIKVIYTLDGKFRSVDNSTAEVTESIE